MQNVLSVEELIDTIINHWSFWEAHERMYLQEVVPKLKARPEEGDKLEAEIFKMLREQLSDAEWAMLPDLIFQRRQACLKDKSLFKPLRKPIDEWRKEVQLKAEADKGEKQRMLLAEAEKRERARQKELRQEAESKRREIQAKLQKVFEQDFLGADYYFRISCAVGMSESEYESEKASFVQRWIKVTIGEELDLEQCAAVGAVNGDTKVTARAGSGKTKTLINRAVFLQKHCGVAPNEMLLMAFNRKAAAEMKERLANTFKDQIPHVMTFHALAYALVHPEEALLRDDPSSENQGLSRAIQTVIDDHLQVPEHKAQIRELMLAHFRKAWDRIIEGHYDKSKEDLLHFKRGLQQQSMRGEYVKSFGEKIIADFLFEHDTPYLYERNYFWSNINYKPDFTIFGDENKKSGAIIEYFGMKGDPNYDKMSQAKKIFWSNKKEWIFLGVEPKNIKDNGVEKFKEKLAVYLRKKGFPCKRLSEDEIWSRVKVRAIDEFTKAAKDFIGRCRKSCLTPRDLNNLISDYSAPSDLEKLFLGIASNLYSSYLKRLNMEGEEDFDGLMQRAVEALSAGTTVFQRKSERGDIGKLRYVFIDEFQDFSELFYRLVIAIRKQNSRAEFFCVGDDWQAINGFAGSELKFFQSDGRYFNWSHQLNITTNYRSPQLIVKVGNALMQGLGRPAAAKKTEPGEVLIANLAEFTPTLPEKEQHPFDVITPAILRLVSNALANGNSVAMLCRTNRLPWFVSGKGGDRASTQDIEAFLELIRSYFPKGLHEKIMISSTHKYKGLEKPVVIVLDAVARSYPLVHPNSVFLRILGDTPDTIEEEERRLFYVALTRAVEQLVIITEQGDRSPFLADIENGTDLSPIDWDAFPPVAGKTSCLVVKVGNQCDQGPAPTINIKEELKASGYQWQSTGWKAWAKSFAATGFNIMSLKKEIWASAADGADVRIFNDQDLLVARYLINADQWKCVFDKLPVKS